MTRRLRSLFRRVARPEVVTLEDVEIVSEGNHPVVRGPGNITADHLEAMVAAQAAFGPAPLKIGHWDARFSVLRDGEAAYGWVQNLRTEERTDKDGKTRLTLIGDYAGVPKKLAGLLVTETDDEGEVLRRAAYPQRSAEILWDVPDPNSGDKHAAVLRAVALMGATNPADKSLEDILEVFYPEDEETEELTAAARNDGATTLLATVNLDTIREAWREAHPYDPSKPETDSWAREVWLDTAAEGTAGFLIVARGDDLERVPWTMDDEGEVSFGTAEVVEVQYVTTAAAENPQYLLAGQLDRPATGGTVSDNGQPSRTGEAATVDRKKIIELLKAKGVQVDDKATDEQLLEALGKLNAEQPAPGDQPKPDDEPKPSEEPKPGDRPAEDQPKPPRAGGPDDGKQDTPEVVPVSKAVWEDTQARLKTLEDERKDRLKEKDQELVDSALSDGRILSAEQDHYMSLLSNSEVHDTTVTLLESLQPGKYPVEEHGGEHNPEAASGDVLAELWPEEHGPKPADKEA